MLRPFQPADTEPYAASGLVTQGANAPIPVVHVWIEPQLRFKAKGDTLDAVRTKLESATSDTTVRRDSAHP